MRRLKIIILKNTSISKNINCNYNYESFGGFVTTKKCQNINGKKLNLYLIITKLCSIRVVIIMMPRPLIYNLVTFRMRTLDGALVRIFFLYK
jgi:hypothetical protein